MLKVTDKAIEKLGQILDENVEGEEYALRIIPAPSNPESLALAPDTEKEGDHVISDNDGKKILLVQGEIAEALGEMTIDFLESSTEGPGFSLSKT